MLEFVPGSAILRVNQNVTTIDCFPSTSHQKGGLDVRVPAGMTADECRLVVIIMGMKFGISLSPNVHFLSPNLRQVGKKTP